MVRFVGNVIHYFRKLLQVLPHLPRRRYNIFAGTNNFTEWVQMARLWRHDGPYDDFDTINEYERELARWCGVKHCVSFGAGRMALYSILEALNIGNGDEVIIPAFTCVVVPNAILYRGARPVYVDIEPYCFNVDVEKVARSITSRTKALYAQHTFGLACDVDGLRDIGRRYGLPVIEDAAHALGMVYRGKPAGSLTEVSFVTTDHSKVINTHLGGAALTDDDRLADCLRNVQRNAPFPRQKILRRLVRSFLAEYICFAPNVLWIGRPANLVLGHLGFNFFFTDELQTTRPTEYPYPCRLSSAQALLGLSQLRELPHNLAHRRTIASFLESRFGRYGMRSDQIHDSAWLRYSLLVRNRHQFELLFKKHFDLGVWFTSILQGRTDQFEAVGYQPGSCPIAEYVAKHIVNFPTHPRIPLTAIQREIDRKWNEINKEVISKAGLPNEKAVAALNGD